MQRIEFTKTSQKIDDKIVEATKNKIRILKKKTVYQCRITSYGKCVGLASMLSLAREFQIHFLKF